MPAYLGNQKLIVAYLGQTPISTGYLGVHPFEVAAPIFDFQAVYIPSNFDDFFRSASSGDSRFVAADNGAGGRFYARLEENEIPIIGALRRQNLLTDLDIAAWGKVYFGAEAVEPVVTNNYLNDPSYGQCARIQLNAGSTGSADNYSWLYKLLTTGETKRRTVSVSTPIRLTAPFSQSDNFVGNGVQTVFMISNWIVDISYISVTVNGVVQVGSGVDFTISGKTLTFMSAPANGAVIVATVSAKCIGMTRGLAGTGAHNVGSNWKTIQQFSEIPSGAGADYGIGLLANRGGILSTSLDVLVPMNALYGPMVEVASDRALPRPNINGSMSYGWGAPGVKSMLGRKAYPLDFTFQGVTRFDAFDRGDTALGVLTDGPQAQEYALYETFLLAPSTQGQILDGEFVMEPPATTPQRAVYAMQTVDAEVSRWGGVVRYEDNVTTNIGPWGFVWAFLLCQTENRFTDDMIHIIGTHLTWSVEIWDTTGAHIVLAEGAFSPPLAYGERHIIDIQRDGETLTFTAPGVKRTITNSRFTAFSDARYLIFEHYVNGPSANRMAYEAVFSEIAGEAPVSSSVYEDFDPLLNYPQFRPLRNKTVEVDYTADLSQAAWTKTGSSVAADPDAVQKIEAAQVWKITEDSGAGTHGISQETGLGAVQQTATAIVRAGERTVAYFTLHNPTDGAMGGGFVDLSRGAVLSGSVTIDPHLGDSVFILSATGTPTVSGTTVYLHLAKEDPGAPGTYIDSYTGDGSSSLNAYYVDAESGPSFTGPIITSAAQGVRDYDKPNAGPILTGTQWTVTAEIVTPPALGYEIILGADGGNIAPIRLTDSGRVQAYNGSGELETPGGTVQASRRHRIAVRRDGASGAIFVDGVKLADGAFSFGFSGSAEIGIGAYPDGVDVASIGAGRSTIQRVRKWSAALSDAACESITA